MLTKKRNVKFIKCMFLKCLSYTRDYVKIFRKASQNSQNTITWCGMGEKSPKLTQPKSVFFFRRCVEIFKFRINSTLSLALRSPCTRSWTFQASSEIGIRSQLDLKGKSKESLALSSTCLCSTPEGRFVSPSHVFSLSLACFCWFALS